MPPFPFLRRQLFLGIGVEAACQGAIEILEPRQRRCGSAASVRSLPSIGAKRIKVRPCILETLVRARGAASVIGSLTRAVSPFISGVFRLRVFSPMHDAGVGLALGDI